MTLLAITVDTTGTVWISQDTAFACYDGPPGSPAEIVGHAQKLYAAPRRNLAVGYAGTAAGLEKLHHALDFEWAGLGFPDLLRRLEVDLGPGLKGGGPWHVAAVGLADGKPSAWLFSSDAPAPVRIEPGQSRMMPVPARDDPAMPRLYVAERAAAQGEDVRRFHCALGQCARGAYLAGRFGALGAVSGEVWSLRLDRNGLHALEPFDLATGTWR